MGFFNFFFKRKSDFKVQKKIKIKWFGNDYGGFFVHPDIVTSDSIVYSFGVGEDITFDEAILSTFNCKVYAFDPTPKSIRWIKNHKDLPENFNFYDYGIGSYDGNISFYPPKNPDYVSCTIYEKEETKNKKFDVPIKKLSTIIKDLKHDKIDILKMDIEGTEYEIIDDILNIDIEIKQILIEFHHRFPNIGIEKTKEVIKKMNENNYKIIAVSEREEEFTFIKN